MAVPFQVVRLQYGFKTGDQPQPIASVDPTEGGPGTQVYWSQELDDPASHHNNNGSYSFVWGPSIGSSAGAYVDGSVHLWIRDLYAPFGFGGYRTEVQGFLTKWNTSDYSQVYTFHELFGEERYAQPSYDQLFWDTSGDVVVDAPGHKPSTTHLAWHWTAEKVLPGEAMRFDIAQMHNKVGGEFVIPDGAGFPAGAVGRPWPGHILRAQLRAKVWPI